MKLKFKHQKFQDDATRAVADIFTSQPNLSREFLIDQGKTAQLFERRGFANPEIKLRDDEILKNLRFVQGQNSIAQRSPRLEKLNGKPAFTVEMETGTGKTYTYINTMFELSNRYGWNKYIVVVPSIAIREGVLKTFQITADHFADRYGKKARFFVYNSSRLTDLETFADDPSINVMIINSQAFNARGADARRIYMELDTFRGRKPIDVIASVNPIVIIDEPQSVIGVEDKKNITRDSLKNFNPLFFINYSATHRENFNMVYRLDAVDAYQQKLVKKITVKGVSIVGENATSGYLYLQSINTYPNKNPDATIVMEYNSETKSGVHKKTKIFQLGDNIYNHSGGVEAYKNGFTISAINDNNSGVVEFTGGLKLAEGECVGNANKEDIRRIQIRETIMSHLEKERELFRKNIKVLSLFFIDEVAKYRGEKDENGIYAEIFDREYKNAIEGILSGELPFQADESYREFLKESLTKTVDAGYFSVDKKGKPINSKEKSTEDDASAYDLIMKDKERLLSFREPVRFIFSHSALREGWDNPNVFQICTLRESQATIKKRQEIGRGLRLCVNADGERQDEENLGYDAVQDINALTVIANESYETFARDLQDEFAEVIKNRPKKISPELFAGKTITDTAGNTHEITPAEAARIFVKLEDQGFVYQEQLTDNYYNLTPELKDEKITEILPDNLKPAVGGVINLINSVYDPKKNPIVSDARKPVELYLDKEKYASNTFKELWGNINHKTVYEVKFDESELIEKCVKAIDERLFVTKTTAIIDTGGLQVKEDDINMRKYKSSTENIVSATNSEISFDLIGEISERVDLTRISTAEILTRIHQDKFALYTSNPEEFIHNAADLIAGEKAATVVEHITYNVINETWDSEDIFVNDTEKGQYGINVIDAKRHLYDKLRYDSNIEKTLAENMDVSDKIELYIKLPKKFYITTPMGKYNPDWAIAIKDGDVKHIYFVAETKGKEGGLASAAFHTTEIEKAKIACAKKHFATISEGKVKYDVISTYEDLIRAISK
ncbi:MAG: DEAD/DEAH box helicase family protein [Candidatus Nomurabacteria bacterium]|jgi:type III restriction enzyme|nr:DEAD/DEAH box helicase family protein [Candidatus Nomurabacteria bacterium]